MPGVRLDWDGKTAEVPRLRLPLQVVETVNASRADRGTLSFDPEPDDGWRPFRPPTIVRRWYPKAVKG